jgi:hypothetical protein
VLPPTNVYTVETRMRLLNANANYQGGIEFRQSSSSAGGYFCAATNQVLLYGNIGGAVNAPMNIGTNWHTYRLTVLRGTNTLYVDNMDAFPLLTTTGSGGGSDWLEFGDFGPIGAGAAEHDYIRWAIGRAYVYVPPKGALILLR